MLKEIVEMLKSINDNFPNDYTNVDLYESGYFDSLSIIRFIELLDEKYSVEIDIDDITAENFSSVNAIEKLIKKYMEKR